MQTLTSFEIQEIARHLRKERLRTDWRDFPVESKSRRHVPYLTQPELADLAGVSEAMLSQIESCRYPNLNQAVLRRICRALKVDAPSETYVVKLLEEPTGITHAIDDLPAWTMATVDEAEPNPAVIINARFDILYWNSAATRMLGDFSQAPPDARNVITSMYLVPDMRAAWADWDNYVVHMVGGLKTQYAMLPEFRDRIMEIVRLVGTVNSDFNQLWEDVDPMFGPAPEKDFIHPRVGLLRLYQTVSQIVGVPHLSLIQFAPRDPETAQAIRRL